MDDALSVRELPSGDLEIGVHIADVSHFVQQVQITPAPLNHPACMQRVAVTQCNNFQISKAEGLR